MVGDVLCVMLVIVLSVVCNVGDGVECYVGDV